MKTITHHLAGAGVPAEAANDALPEI